MESAAEDLKASLKAMMVEELMLTQTPDEIGDGTPIFAPEGLALDSVDALQLVVALEKRFGLRLPDAEAARSVLHSVDSMAEAVASHRAQAEG